MKVLFHVQHLLGIGHHRRAERLARALATAGLEVTVASGGRPPEDEDWGGAEVLRLPSAAVDGRDFSRLCDADGQPIDDAWRADRRDRLLDLFGAIRPDILLLEGYPFARRQFRFELDPLLATAAAARPRPLVATSVRDILVAKPDREDEAVAIVRRSIDAVLVHGDPALVPFEATFAAAGRIADRLHYTGYVGPELVAPLPEPMAPAEAAGAVLVSAGGGAVGEPLLSAAVEAFRLGAGAGRPWRLVCGRFLPQAALRQITDAAPPGLAIDGYRADFAAWLGAAGLSVSQAGYNTVLEALIAGVRMLLVPFAAPGETEQPLRAELLARAGRALVVPEAELSGTALAAAIDRALAMPAPPVLTLRRDGARETARLLAELAQAVRALS